MLTQVNWWFWGGAGVAGGARVGTAKTAKDLKLDKRNANRGTKRGAEILALSLEEGGAGRSVLADRDLNVLAGNQTVKAWRQRGGKIRIVETTGDELVVVQRTDISLDDPETEQQARRVALFDNRSSETGLEWDTEIMQEDAGLGLLSGMWTDDEMAELFAAVALPDEAPVADGVADYPSESPDGLSDTILSIGEYRTFIQRDEYLEWLEQIREEVGFDKESIVAEIRRRVGLDAD